MATAPWRWQCKCICCLCDNQEGRNRNDQRRELSTESLVNRPPQSQFSTGVAPPQSMECIHSPSPASWEGPRRTRCNSTSSSGCGSRALPCAQFALSPCHGAATSQPRVLYRWQAGKSIFKILLFPLRSKTVMTDFPEHEQMGFCRHGKITYGAKSESLTKQWAKQHIIQPTADDTGWNFPNFSFKS